MWSEHSLSSIPPQSDPLPCSNLQWLALQGTRVGVVAVVNIWEYMLGVYARQWRHLILCHSRCIGINKIYILNPTSLAKLLQYSGYRVEHRDGFSSYKRFAVTSKMVNLVWILRW